MGKTRNMTTKIKACERNLAVQHCRLLVVELFSRVHSHVVVGLRLLVLLFVLRLKNEKPLRGVMWLWNKRIQRKSHTGVAEEFALKLLGQEFCSSELWIKRCLLSRPDRFCVSACSYVALQLAGVQGVLQLQVQGALRSLVLVSPVLHLETGGRIHRLTLQ